MKKDQNGKKISLGCSSVKDLDAGIKRIYEHVLPLEDQRMKKVHGPSSGSNVNKLLIINNELNPNRLTLIFVKEDLGF